MSWELVPPTEIQGTRRLTDLRFMSSLYVPIFLFKVPQGVTPDSSWVLTPGDNGGYVINPMALCVGYSRGP